MSKVALFRQAMAAKGFITQDEIVADGQFHSFHVEGDRPQKEKGRYILHLDPYPLGTFWVWNQEERHTWKLPFPKHLSREERGELEKRCTEARTRQDAEIERVRAKARAEAEYIWNNAPPAPEDHLYLQTKKVGANGSRLDKGWLLLPVCDVGGALHSLQFISPLGEKRFLGHGRIGGCCLPLGSPGKRIYIAEGFATAATIHQVTGEAVVAAFMATNLKAVAEALRKKYPKADSVIAADNDAWTDGNPGLTKAREAAKAVKGQVAVPYFKNTATHPTDFNDLFRLEGAESVRRRLGQACKPDLAEPGPGVRASEVEARKVEWLWHNWIPQGEVAILDGDPGVGKSTIALDFGARVTRGWQMPDGSDPQLVPRGVVVVTLEDSPSHTIRPRLEAAAADLERVHIITTIHGPDGTNRLPSIPEDLPEIEKAIREVDAALVIVDPFIGCLTPEANSWKDQDVRRALAPLEQLAERTGVAVLAIRHLNKTSGGNALYRGGGSIALIAGARAGLLAARDPDDPNYRVLAMTKSNLGPEQTSLRYRLEAPDGIVRVTWEGESPHRAVNLLVDSEGEEERSIRSDAKEFIRALLADNPVPSEEILAKGRKQGFSDRTMNRAKKDLGVRSRLIGQGRNGRWEWALPENAKYPSRGCQYRELGNL